MKRYNLINNSLGWLCFVIAAVTYLLTLEPTASFWDCPEFIAQGTKLEVGHPPGNPIFILTARFFVNFAGSDPSNAAVAVNAMSALLSAGTILLLFWTITHLMRRLLVGRSEQELTVSQMLIVMGSGLVGALAYTWSDTFWFSAVEGEVYAFSSFCTALVFWLILKWDTRADRPHSDKYLVAVAFVIGISIAVHLLNLLTIPALALVVYFRKAAKPAPWKALVALLISFVIVALILFGLVPGFIEVAQYFELFFVNTLHVSYNIGVLVYAIILVATLIWCVRSLYVQKSVWQIRVSFVLSVVLSGMLFMGSSLWIPGALTIALILYMFLAPKLYVRFLNIVALSILVIFVGYSSYALLLIRSSANPPMNQNSPDNVFALSSYLNREQYGETPLFFGPSFGSTLDINTYRWATTTPDGSVKEFADYTISDRAGSKTYVKEVKTSESAPDAYIPAKPKSDYVWKPTMFFPRLYESGHTKGYLKWMNIDPAEMDSKMVTINMPNRFTQASIFDYPDIDGRIVGGDNPAEVVTSPVNRPSFRQNLNYFIDYQLNYMYWRYFMWNFAGRQNDIQGQGELTRGNWISGIDFIDNARLGDQSLLPPELGVDNKGHNVFYMLPLLLGLLGIVAQFMRGVEGRRQFWVIMMLFFMTGIAIVFYLNQYPDQPRERDYAFAGSFYAFAIWIGLGVYALWRLLCAITRSHGSGRRDVCAAAAAVVLGLIVPLQMVSQTWDDHDRSGRYAARDFGMNYLSSLDENAIIFTMGDNDTFPLWYAQEVEGYRTDVRVVNLAYLNTDWYANHAKMPSYDAPAIPFLASEADYANDRLTLSAVRAVANAPTDVFTSLSDLYGSDQAYDEALDMRVMRYPNIFIPSHIDEAVAAGVITPAQRFDADEAISVSFADRNRVTLADVLSLDILATSADNGWSRPVYFASTVPDENYLGLQPYMRSTGLAYQVTPLRTNASGYSIPTSTDKMYDNVVNHFRWGGLDQGRDLYLDETVRRMVASHRYSMIALVNDLYNEGFDALEDGDSDRAAQRFSMAVDVLELMDAKLPVTLAPYSLPLGEEVAQLYIALGEALDDQALIDKGVMKLLFELDRYAPYVPYLRDLVRRQQREYAEQGIQRVVTINDVRAHAVERYAPVYIRQLIGDLTDAGMSEGQVTDILDGYGIDFDSLNTLLGEKKK